MVVSTSYKSVSEHSNMIEFIIQSKRGTKKVYHLGECKGHTFKGRISLIEVLIVVIIGKFKLHYRDWVVDL